MSQKIKHEMSLLTEQDIHDIKRAITVEAINTVSGLITQIRRISQSLQQDREYIEFLYIKVYLPNKDYFDSLSDEVGGLDLDSHARLLLIVGTLLETFCYKGLSYDRYSTTDDRFDSRFAPLKISVLGNLPHWVNLGWIEVPNCTGPMGDRTPLRMQVLNRIKLFLSVSLDGEKREEIAGYPITEQGMKIREEFLGLLR